MVKPRNKEKRNIYNILMRLQATSHKHQAPSEDRYKLQASSDKQQASGFLNPSLTSARIQVPGNSLQEA